MSTSSLRNLQNPSSEPVMQSPAGESSFHQFAETTHPTNPNKTDSAFDPQAHKSPDATPPTNDEVGQPQDDDNDDAMAHLPEGQAAIPCSRPNKAPAILDNVKEGTNSPNSSGAERDARFVQSEEFEYHTNTEELVQPKVVKDNSDLGICAENVAAIAARQPKVKTKSTLLDEIKSNGEEMAEFHATPMLLARTVGSYLESKGLGRSSAGAPLKSYQVLGDMLGSGGCNLPRIRIRGKMVYAVRFVNSSAEEKAEAQGRLDSLTSIERKAMKIA